jgi:glycosyltransferase involved in cell wall biosynthesis
LTQAFARYGDIAYMDVFSPLSRMDICRQRLPATSARGTEPGGPVTRLAAESDIAVQCRACHYDILHDSLAGDFTRTGYVRSRFCRRVLPITCSQMGISYSFLLGTAFMRLLSAQIYPCDAVVCSTKSSRHAMEKRLTDLREEHARFSGRPPSTMPRLELIPWGVDTLRFAPREQAPARRDLNLPPDRPILLCMGRMLIQDKMDCTPLLLAFKRIAATAKQRPLLILAGPSPSEYGQRLLDQVRQLGLQDDVRAMFNVPPACLSSLYAASDVFVSPADSPSESFGLTIVEAMACGRPVVASDWDGYAELIVHGETGFKIRTDWADCLNELNEMAPAFAWDHEHLHVGQSVSVDVGEMVSYLALLVDNPGLRAEMGRRVRDRVLGLYDWPVVIRRWEAMWAELAAVARTVQPEDGDRFAHLQPNYFKHFSHYASRIIDDPVGVQLTDQGRAFLAGSVPLYLHPQAQAFLNPRYLGACLAILAAAQPPEPGLSVGALVEALGEHLGLGRDAAVMHLMWLAKYDLLCLSAVDP